MLQKEKVPKIITDQNKTQWRTFLSVRGGFSENKKTKTKVGVLVNEMALNISLRKEIWKMGKKGLVRALTRIITLLFCQWLWMVKRAFN